MEKCLKLWKMDFVKRGFSRGFMEAGLLVFGK